MNKINSNANRNAKKRKSSSRANSQSKGHRTASKMSSTKDITSNAEASLNNIKGINDFAWYNANPLLTEAAARIPFPYKPGMAIQYASNPYMLVDGGGSIKDPKHSIPGVLAIEWVPTIGKGDSPTDPASLVAKEMYAKVRSKFSGSLDADGPDFVIYLMALDSIFSYIGSLKRLYRALDAYNPNNYTIPGEILSAYGIPGDRVTELRANKDILWSNINSLIAMTSKFICPDVMPLFNRHYWLNDNVYADAPKASAQMYIFIQAGFYKFKLFEQQSKAKETYFVGGLELVPPPSWGPTRSVSEVIHDYFSFGRQLIDALASSDDGYTISGYLQRAFEGSAMFGVAQLQQNEAFTPIYVPEVLMQIENATNIGITDWNSDMMNEVFDIHQNPKFNTVGQKLEIDGLKYSAYAEARTLSYEPVPMLNIRNDAPTVPEVVEASRLSSYIDYEDTGKIFRIICATECVLDFVVCYPNEQVVDGSRNGFKLSTAYVTAADELNPIAVLATISKFDWHPRLVITESYLIEQETYHSSNTLWDYYNPTTFSISQLDEINRVCLLSELGIFA